MGALIAIASILGLLYVKHTAAAGATAGSTAGAFDNARITGAPDPSVSYDTKAPMQADPIGNTHLSISDPVFNGAGEVVGLPYRPSDPAYGGGISDLAGVEGDAYPSGGPGSGISAIEKLNAPHARSPIPGGAYGRNIPTPRIPLLPTFRRVVEKPTAPVRVGDTGSGKLPIVPPSHRGPAQRHPVAPLRPTIAVNHSGVSSTAAHLTNAANQPKPAAKPSRPPAARRPFFSRSASRLVRA